MSRGAYEPGSGLHQFSGSFVHKQVVLYSPWVSFSDLFFLKGGVRITDGGSCKKERVNSLPGGKPHGEGGGWGGTGTV